MLRRTGQVGRRAQGGVPARGGLRASAGVLALAALLGGCSLGEQSDPAAQAGEQKGYIAGDGSLLLIAPSERGDAVAITGEEVEGDTLDVTALRGDVVVLNLWYAGCGPCRAEARDLAEIAEESADQGVSFVGINTRDSAATAAGFERTFDVPYPSVLDADSGEAVLALEGLASPQAIPTTIVLDREGRPAARVLGRADPDVLREVIEDEAGEPA